MDKKIATPFEPIKSTRAHEAVLAQLQQKILEGELKPGARLPSEREMMTTFGVSRPTIREALRVAESLGLVTVRHGDPGGPRVLGQPSVGVTRILEGLLTAERTSVAELLETRMVLEGAAARLAALQPIKAQKPVEEAFLRMEKAVEVAEFVEADALFHQRIAEVGGNHLVLLILTSLHEPILRLIKTGLGSATASIFRDKIMHMHAEILRSLRGHDALAADQRSRRHVFELYSALVSAPQRLRLQALLD